MYTFLKKHWLLLCILFIGSFLRFYNPLWDNGLFLHPDERLFINASSISLPKTLADFFSPNSSLNPHMFYYGSTLLYLYRLTSLLSPFSLLVTSRLISAFFSAMTVGVVYVIGLRLFSKKVGVLSSITFAFAAGSIQYAHFNTTESSLLFFLSLITYIDIVIVQKKDVRLLLISLSLVAIAGSIKITGLFFGLSPLLSFFLLLKERVGFKKVTAYWILGLFLCGIIYILLSPYEFIDWSNFNTQQSYMQAVTYGVFKPPFVLIYQNTFPYIYQILSIFPFIFGFVSFPLSLIGIGLICKDLVKHKAKKFLYIFLLLFPLIYFGWSGGWFAKYARYYLLLLPFLALFAGYALSKMQKLVQIILILCVCINGLLFFRIYFYSNTRVEASKWIYDTIQNNSIIATEHWDDTLPLLLPDQTKNFINLTLPVYDTETNKKIHTLATITSQANYIILSSRRVYVSILDNQEKYPQTSLFYKDLFSGSLGYKIIYSKTMYPFFISDDSADETFQSYDHPPVIVFQNTLHYSAKTIESLLQTH